MLSIKSKSKPGRVYNELFSSNGEDCTFEYPKLLVINDMEEEDLGLQTACFKERAKQALGGEA